MKNIRLISKMVKKKTSTYLKCSFILFIFMMILMSTSFVSIINQYYQLKKDFIDNENMHVIEVNSVIDESQPNTVEALKFKDRENIDNKIKEKYPKINYEIYTEYSMNIGVSDYRDNTFFIYSIDKNLSDKLGINFDKRTGYLTDKTNDIDTILQIPVISDNDGGYVAEDYNNYNLSIKQLPKLNSPFIDTNIDKLYVSEDTYKNILGEMFKIANVKFEENKKDGTDFGVQSINKILIYVDDLSEVKSVGSFINKMGYNSNYVFDAFDDMSGSLKNTMSIGMILILFILVITGINIIVSFNLYFKNMQKDIGILSHYGYDRDLIYKIYKMTFTTLFEVSLVLILIYSAVISMLLVKAYFLQTFIFTSLILICMMYTIKIFISKELKKICVKDTLDLLKHCKEFE